jgi:hypothetical protein
MFKALINFFGSDKKQNYVLPQEPSIDQIRPRTRILFVDDEKFAVVENMVNNGWTQAKRIKDVDNLNHPDIQNTDIFFVDIQGVGRKLNFIDEGLGLARALKETYPSKIVILYSAQTQGDRFDKTLSIVDDTIRKNADTYEFIRLTEQWSKEIFSPSRAIERAQDIIKKETGRNVTYNEIEKVMSQQYNDSSSITPDSLSKILDISKATAETIAAIVSIFKPGN